jgi:hypothetical protein
MSRCKPALVSMLLTVTTAWASARISVALMLGSESFDPMRSVQ